MSSEYYISMYHHRHGTDAAVICGEPAVFWAEEYEPDREDEFFTRAELPPLFQAAPEMLNALRGVAERWDKEDEADDPVLGAVIRSAIASADGRTHADA